MSSEQYVPLAGSDREPVAGARRLGPADPDEHFEVTVVLRPKAPVERTATAGRSQPMSREDLAAEHGADPEDVARVERFAAGHRLQVVERSVGRRSVVLAGTTAAMERAFGVELAVYEHEGGGTYRGRIGDVRVPAELSDRVVAVLGLDNRPQARPHMRISHEIGGGEAAAHAAGGAFTPVDLARLYDFPSGADGTGQCIAIVELGGGFRTSDIEAYFAQLGLEPPVVTAVSVDHGRNRPSFPSSADGEVMLDIEVAGAVAPGSHIAVYFAPNTSRGFHDAVAHAVHDTVNRPAVVSISWGGAESTWTAQAIAAMDQAFADAAALGVTVYCAAGDAGSSDGRHDGRAHVDFPASSPHVVACGGTHLVAAGGEIRREVVWQTNGATGGGVSDVFDPPSWQADANVPASANPPGTHHGRGVPDVAGDADPATGYVIRVDGRQFVIGGTSAVAPLWAGLTAVLNQRLGTPVGFLNPVLYEIGGDGPSGHAFRDITRGSNGDYDARAGWDACTGWGSPSGNALLAALQG